MKHLDIVWGNVVINDYDTLDIINHKAMQRTKNIWISAYGYLFQLLRNSTRYEHMIGVYLLLKHFKASKQEQIAGLIHDVSHTAFSHVSTYAMQGKYTGVEFHEHVHHKIIETSGLDKTLKLHGYNIKEVLNIEHFSLAENNLPDICADRLDYTLRDALHLQIISRQQADKIIKGLTVKNKEFMFRDIESAFTYSFAFYLLNLTAYGSASEAYFNHSFGNLVKYAMGKRILKENDWFSDDVKVINKLKRSSNKQIKKWFASYNNKMIVYEDSKNPDFILSKKIRIVDPKIIQKGKIKRLSEISPEYNKLISDYKKTHTKHELPIKVLYKN